MTSKNKDVEVLSFSIPKVLLRDMDKISKEVGYQTRSELIRDGIRALIKSKTRMDNISGKVEGVLIALYSFSAESKVSEIRHHNMDIIASFMHSDFQERSAKCCDIVILKGRGEKIRRFVYDLESTKNVEEVQLFVA